jgi:hypothetical protein
MPSIRAQPRSRRAGRDAVTVKVITYAPTAFSHCQHCEVAFGEVGLGERIRREEAASALPPDLALEFARLSDWVRRVVDLHGPSIHVEVIDAASVEGLLASLRHGVWRHPAVLVEGQRVTVGTDYSAAEPVIEREIVRRAQSLGVRADESRGRPVAGA